MEMSFVYYWLLIGCLILSMTAQARIRSAYAKYSRRRADRGCTAREMVTRMMREEGIENVAVGQVPGELTDHYDPKSLTLRLSAGTADSDSIAALAVAAHEMGHVLQHRDAYAPLSLRTLIAPTVQIGSSLAMPLLILGLVLSYGPLVQAGIVLYALITLFTFITLPVEFNASHRALLALERGGYLTEDELPGARKVLSAAALTYVASALTALVQCLRLISLYGSRKKR